MYLGSFLYKKFDPSEINSDKLFLSFLSGNYNKFPFMEDIPIRVCFPVNTRVNVWAVPSLLLPCV